MTELKNERPQWILSAFGPVKELPVQLFGGYPREQSCEELRLRHYELAAAGNPQEAIQEAQTLFNNAEQQIRTALDDVEGAIRYLNNKAKEHPNRFDTCEARGTDLNGSRPSGSAFGQPTAPKSSFEVPATSFGQPTGASGFGQPSALGSRPSPFGQQATASGQSSAFGQPAQLGRPSTSFGQPTSSFGQPFVPAPAFGKPSNPTSAFGQSVAPKSAFGQPSFGQPSAPPAFGQNSLTSVFGAPATLGSSQQSAFGQPSTLQQSAFNQQSVGTTQPSAFGKPSASASPFEQASQPARTSGFGQTNPATTNPFGQPVANQSTQAFRQPSATGSGSGHASIQSANAPMHTLTQPSNGFGNLSAPTTSTALSQPTATLAASSKRRDPATRDAQGKLKTWNGEPVTYVDNEPCTKGNDGAWEKVCFPDGPPTLTKAEELAEVTYDESTKENYMFMRTHEAFKDGMMPSLPPRREWCNWDF